uniref:MADF domain-containing protein n=1 Tax=Timema douglasi TaxID=61478 RepID=A0A7R8ZBE5_TIMDO|nr:unnamed protein product [Timema douglasi]
MEAKYFAELDEKLIDLVKSHPILYQLSDKNYKDNFMKENVWIEIAASLGKAEGSDVFYALLLSCPFPRQENARTYWQDVPLVAVPECKTRWRTIRDSYRKIKNKKKQKGSRAGVPAKSKYNDQKLRFLDEAILKRTDEDEEDEEADDSLVLEDKTPKRKGCGPAAPKKRNKIDRLTEEAWRERYNQLFDEITEQRNLPADHPIQTFFKSMASTVMTFPPHLIAETRMNVCNIVSEMEIRALRENSYGTSLERDDASTA